MYGKHRRTLRCSWHDFWPSAYYLLQVAILCPLLSLAEFTSSDSETLYDIYRRVDDIAVDAQGIKDMLSDLEFIRLYLDRIDTAVANGGYVYERLNSISFHASDIASRVVNIESASIAAANGISGLHDMLDSRLWGISNAIANIPRCNVVLTNLLNASGNVDMGMVTNLMVFSMAGVPVGEYGIWWAWDSLGRFVEEYGGSLGWGDDTDAYDSLLISSPWGLVMGAMSSALGLSAKDWTFPDYFRRSETYWFQGQGYDESFFNYSIFDAYNTLGLGVLTNQVATLLSVAHANTNLLTQMLSVLDDSDHGLAAIASAVATSSVALGTSGEGALDYSADYKLPEWEPTYSREVDATTNVFEYDDALSQMTQSMFRDTTNKTSTVFEKIGNVQAGGDLYLAFDFSGFELGPSLQDFAPWSVSTSFDGLEEVKDFFKTLSRYMFYVLDLCLVIIGCRRIQRAIIGDVGIL